jgi:hypothetical protein
MSHGTRRHVEGTAQWRRITGRARCRSKGAALPLAACGAPRLPAFLRGSRSHREHVWSQSMTWIVVLYLTIILVVFSVSLWRDKHG